MTLSRNQVEEFYQRRRSVLRNLPVVKSHLGLGPEYKLLVLFVERCTPTRPWMWVQSHTQEHWAGLWGLSRPTLQRHLHALKEHGLISAELLPDMQPKNAKKKYLLPVYSIDPIMLNFIENYNDMWTPKDSILRLNEMPVKPQFEAYTTHAEYPSQGTYKLHTDPELIPDTHTDTGVEGTDTNQFTNGASRAHDLSIYIDTNVDIHTHMPTDIVRRRLRRRTAKPKDHTMRRRPPEDDVPTVFGADPDKPASSDSRPGSGTPASKALAHFDESWHAHSHNNSLGAEYPRKPWGTVKSRVACISWIKGTLLPDHDEDEELVHAIIDHFCAQVAAQSPGWAYKPNPEKGVWDLWRHLSPRVSQTRASLVKSGWVSQADKDRAVQAEAARAGRVESQRIKANASRNKASAEEKAASEAVIIIPLSASGLPEWVGYEWIISAQTSDYLDWVDSPWQGSRPR